MRPLRARLLGPGFVFALLAALAVPAGPAAAHGRGGPKPERTTVWLCRPGLPDDPCRTDLVTTVFDADGNEVGVERDRSARRSKVDCFYVYPTVSDQPTPAADLTIDPEVRSIARFQAARFASECRVFAPVYRQLTLSNIGGGGGGPTPEMVETAYQDVRSAFLEYLRYDNRGRGIVLIGHSQGSSHLRRLVAEEIDPNRELRRQLVSAMLLGSTVSVPRGEDVGGDFQHIPACRSDEQTGCVISFATFGSEIPAETRFGRTADPAREALCTNPAALGGGSAPIDSIEPTEPFAPGTTIALAISALGRPPTDATTPWVEFRDAYDAECVTSEAGADVLQVTPRGSAPELNAVPDPTWGLHLVDVSIALGDLLDVVESQADAWRHGRGHGRGDDHDHDRGRDHRRGDRGGSGRGRGDDR